MERTGEISVTQKPLTGDTDMTKGYNRLRAFLQNHSYDELRESSALFNNQQYYVPKAFVIVSESPYFHEYREILVNLYYICKMNITYPYEYYFRYITYEVPKPGRGSRVQFLMPNGETIELTNSLRSELPTIQTNFYWEVFATINYLTFDENFITVLYWFLCQVGSTVLISSDPNKLISLAEVLRTIIFPFEYDDSYMPLISETNYGYLSAPFPVLIGVVATSEDDVREVEMAASEKSLLVYIDKDELKVKFGADEPLSLKDFRKEYDEDHNKQFSYKNFPSKPLKELKKKMKKLLKECKKDIEKGNILYQTKEVYVASFREFFLDFFASMFRNYEKYVEKSVDNSKSDAQKTFTNAFDQNLFLRKESDKYHFFIDLFNTRAWILFLENKLYASTVEAEIQIELFDKRIREKFSKSKKLGFMKRKSDPAKLEKENSKSSKHDESTSDYFSLKETSAFEIPDTITGEFMTLKSLSEKYLVYYDSTGIKFQDYVEITDSKNIPHFGYLVIPEFSKK